MGIYFTLSCLILYLLILRYCLAVACSRRSDSGARAKKKASERAGKKRGEAGEEEEGTPVKLILKGS